MLFVLIISEEEKSFITLSIALVRLTSGVVFTTLHFIYNLQMGRISHCYIKIGGKG
jgi:hypothetical protein